ncbi:MAG TPA: PLP-dependent aminotransferase family protein [Acidimicrobiia bacterium]|nr:PLP-dependent aminotransferase family protein [Acidimicrobiia bacterium]
MAQNLLELVGSPEALAAGDGPLYQRLAAAVTAAVEEGRALPGMVLPPERALAEQMGVSRSTVVAAYDRLRDAGVVERRQGSGTRITARAAQRASNAREEELVEVMHRNVLFRGVIEGTEGRIDFLAAHHGATERFPAVMAAANEELASAALQHGYFPGGYPPLRRAIAEYLTAKGVPTAPGEVLVTNGAQQAISLAMAFLVQRGDAVAIENPSYPGVIDAAAGVGAQMVPIPVGADGARLGALADILATRSPRVVYLNPTFQNPTGCVMPDAARAEVARLVSRHQTVLIDDCAVVDLRTGAEPPPPIASHAPDAPILTVGSMSKLFWGGLRVGWVRAPAPLRARLTGFKAMLDLGSSVPSQVLATHLLADIDAIREERRAEAVAKFRLLDSLMSELLPSWSWSIPGGGLWVWARMPAGSARDLAAEAQRAGVAILPGPTSSCDLSFNNHIRLTIARTPEVLTEGIRRLASAWERYLPRAEGTGDALEVIV